MFLLLGEFLSSWMFISMNELKCIINMKIVNIFVSKEQKNAYVIQESEKVYLFKSQRV